MIDLIVTVWLFLLFGEILGGFDAAPLPPPPFLSACLPAYMPLCFIWYVEYIHSSLSCPNPSIYGSTLYSLHNGPLLMIYLAFNLTRPQ